MPLRYNYYFDHFIFFPNSCLGFVSGSHLLVVKLLRMRKLSRQVGRLGLVFGGDL